MLLSIRPAASRWKVGHTLNKPPVLRQTALPLDLACASLCCGWKQEGSHKGRGETMPTHHADTHTRRGVFVCVCVCPNPQPPCYEAAELSTAPLDGSDSNGLMVTATSASAPSRGWTCTDCLLQTSHRKLGGSLPIRFLSCFPSLQSRFSESQSQGL